MNDKTGVTLQTALHLGGGLGELGLGLVSITCTRLCWWGWRRIRPSSLLLQHHPLHHSTTATSGSQLLWLNWLLLGGALFARHLDRQLATVLDGLAPLSTDMGGVSCFHDSHTPPSTTNEDPRSSSSPSSVKSSLASTLVFLFKRSEYPITSPSFPAIEWHSPSLLSHHWTPLNDGLSSHPSRVILEENKPSAITQSRDGRPLNQRLAFIARQMNGRPIDFLKLCVAEFIASPISIGWSGFQVPFRYISAAELRQYGTDQLPLKQRATWQKAVQSVLTPFSLNERQGGYLTMHMLRLCGEHESALAFYRRVCAMDPHPREYPISAHHNALRCMLALGDVDSALELCNSLHQNRMLSDVAHGIVLKGLKDLGRLKDVHLFVVNFNVDLSGFRGFITLQAVLECNANYGFSDAVEWTIHRILNETKAPPNPATVHLMLRHYITNALLPPPQLHVLLFQLFIRHPCLRSNNVLLLGSLMQLVQAHYGSLKGLRVGVFDRVSQTLVPGSRAHKEWNKAVVEAFVSCGFEEEAISYRPDAHSI